MAAVPQEQLLAASNPFLLGRHGHPLFVRDNQEFDTTAHLLALLVYWDCVHIIGIGFSTGRLEHSQHGSNLNDCQYLTSPGFPSYKLIVSRKGTSLDDPNQVLLLPGLLVQQ
jgi:hypothetical protein